MITPARGIHLRRAAEFRQRRHQRVVQHAALMQILDQRAVALVVHRRHLLFHLLHGNKRLRPVDVPRELIEHREKTIERHHAHAVFDEPPRE